MHRAVDLFYFAYVNEKVTFFRITEILSPTHEEEYEAMELSLKYGKELCYESSARFGYNLSLVGDGATVPYFEMHLRYRIADRCNFYLKKYFGRLHHFFKTLLLSKEI